MTLKNLFNPDLADEIKQRLMSMHPDSARQWGSMTPAQAIAHCTYGLQMAMGVIHPRRVPFPANMIGSLIKPLVFSDDKPIRRNSPSAPELFKADSTTCDFERERTQLIAAIDSFVTQKATCCTVHPHPFFGRLAPEQWAILMYKHLDHHLRQFSA